jgi:hypothetical protein
VTEYLSGVAFILEVFVFVAVFLAVPLLLLWAVSWYAQRDRSGTGQRLGIIAMRSGRVSPWGSAGGSHTGDFDIKAAERSIRGILGQEPGPAEVQAARAFLLEIAFDPMLLSDDVREMLGRDWTERPLDDDPASHIERLLSDDPGPAEIRSARLYVLDSGCDPALLPGRVRQLLGMEWTEHQGSPMDRAVRGVSTLLGRSPGTNEIGSARRYLDHIGYDAAMLPEDLRVLLATAEIAPAVGPDAALT